MKRQLLLTAITVFFSLTLFAQHFGIQGGGLAVNTKWRNDRYTLNTVPKPGFMAGVALDIPLKNSMVINTALNYRWVGAALIDSTDVEALQLGYINLDITVGYVFETVKVVQPYVEGGTYGGYLVNSKRVFVPENGDAYSENITVGYNEDDEIIPIDFGWSIGGGVYLGKWKFGLGYQASFIDLSPNPEVIMRNKTGYLRVTYFFGRDKLKSN